MPVLQDAPLEGEPQELPLLADPPPVANDNAADTTWIIEGVPKPLGWKRATAMVLGSGLMAAFFMLCLLFVAVG